MYVSEVIVVFRDVAIIVLAVTTVVALLGAVVGGFLFYRKVKPMLDWASTTSRNAEEITTGMSRKLVKPLLGRAGFAVGLGQTLAFIAGYARKNRSGSMENNEHHSHSKNHGSGFTVGLIFGGIIAGMTALLLAPKIGKETGSVLWDRGSKLRWRASEALSVAAGEARDLAARLGYTNRDPSSAGNGHKKDIDGV